ncbi:MAG: hypothetical protein Kow0025_18430 [Thermodesulfovibrionales bacterium]
MRKIDDEKLLAMLKEGRTQKEAAEFFGVSCPAVCKRVKRLNLTKALRGLTKRERKFAIEKAKGASNVAAAMQSYEVTSMASARVIGSQLMAKPEIQMAISELMDYHGLTKSYRIKKLRQHVDHPDPTASLKALDMSFKLDGSYAPERHDLSILSLTAIIRAVEKERQGPEDEPPIEAEVNPPPEDGNGTGEDLRD